MKSLPFLLSILFQELKKPRFLIIALISSFLFVLLALFLLNYKSYASFAFADYSIISKIKILILITIGSFSAITYIDAIFLFATSILFGLNLTLTIEKIKILKKAGDLRLTVGAGIVSLAATGCASCGLSLASLAGLTSVIVLLPFGGLELYVFSVILLLLLLFYNLHTFVKACKLL